MIWRPIGEVATGNNRETAHRAIVHCLTKASECHGDERMIAFDEVD